MSQRSFDWITGAFVTWREPTQSFLDQLGPDLFGGGVQYLLIDSAQLEGKNDDLLFERVVGTTLIAVVDSNELGTGNPAYAAMYECIERIYVSEADLNGDPDTAHQLFVEDDFDRSWLWERRTIRNVLNVEQYVYPNQVALKLQGGLGETYDSGWVSHIDVGVKRRLGDRQILVYDIEVEAIGFAGGTVPGEVSLVTAPRLRVGVKS